MEVVQKALYSEEDLEAFETLMDICRNNAMASGAACNPIIFEPMVMSIILAQSGEEISKLEYKLNGLVWQRVCA